MTASATCRKAEENPHIGVSEADRIRFRTLCENAARTRRSEGNGGFGTLAEKRMHAVIKQFICQNEDLHEVGVAGTRFISDVRIGNNVYEVQSGAFYPMKKKIAYYLEQTPCTVTIVHPIIVNKWITDIDHLTGELSPRKRSPAHGRPSDLLPELYSLLPHLGDPRLRFRLLLVEAEEFRLSNARRHRGRLVSARYERFPLALLDVWELASAEDFRRFLPVGLPSPFTVKDFSCASRLRGRNAYSAVRVLAAFGLLRSAAPIGRAMAFEIV